MGWAIARLPVGTVGTGQRRAAADKTWLRSMAVVQGGAQNIRYYCVCLGAAFIHRNGAREVAAIPVF